MSANWFIDLLRTLFFFIDSIIYPLIGKVYNLLMTIANTTIFTEEVIDMFASKVYALLGIFMLFKVSFSILTYIVNPDEFADKNKGFSKIITNIIITLTLLVTTPWIFSQAMDIQRIVLKDNVIGRIFSVGPISNISVDTAGDTMAYDTFSAFYNFDTEADSQNYCSGLAEGADLNNNNNCKNYFNNSDKYSKFVDIISISYSNKSIDHYLKETGLLNQTNSNGGYVMHYLPLISSVAGVFVCWILIMFCFDVAVRSIKLGFLRMISPIPIVSRIDPKKGMELFNKWVKNCLSTYIDLFVRLLAIHFALFVIAQIGDLDFVDIRTGVPTKVDAFVKVFIILGALLFAKELPKLLEELLGIKMSGKFTLDPRKKLGESPFAAAAIGAGGAMLGGAAANMYNGIKTNKGFKGVLKTAGSTLAGASSGFFKGGYAGFSGKGKDNVMKAASTGLKGSVDARNLRTSRIQSGDGGISGVMRRTGVTINNMAGIESGASKYDKQIAKYDEFLKEQSGLDSYVEGEINKGKHTDPVRFEWTDVHGRTIRSTANINILKHTVEQLKQSGASAEQIANAELAYGKALSQAKIDYIEKHKAGSVDPITGKSLEDGAIVSMMSNMEYIRSTHSELEGFAGMPPINTGQSWDDSKKAIKSAKSHVISSTEYRQEQINRKNDAKK